MPPGARRRGSELSIASDQRRQKFGYDGLGNWLTFNSDDGDGSTWDLEQSRTNNLANEITGITETQDDPVWVDPAYDEAGSMISGPKPGAETEGHGYVYDAWNRLRRVFDDEDADAIQDTGEETLQESQYDGLNRRVARIVADGSNWQRTDFYYNSSWQILEMHREGQITTLPTAQSTPVTDVHCQYVWDQRYIDSPVLRDEDLDSDGDCTDDEPAGSERLCYANDANFNVTALVETDGAVAERTIYDAYGQPTLYDSSWSNTISESASKANELRFCGYVYDAAVGLYTVRYRVYDPGLGRWVQRDPAGYADGMGLYEYCKSSPTGRLDDTGQESDDSAYVQTESSVERVDVDVALTSALSDVSPEKGLTPWQDWARSHRDVIEPCTDHRQIEKRMHTWFPHIQDLHHSKHGGNIPSHRTRLKRIITAPCPEGLERFSIIRWSTNKAELPGQTPGPADITVWTYCARCGQRAGQCCPSYPSGEQPRCGKSSVLFHTHTVRMGGGYKGEQIQEYVEYCRCVSEDIPVTYDWLLNDTLRR